MPTAAPALDKLTAHRTATIPGVRRDFVMAYAGAPQSWKEKMLPRLSSSARQAVPGVITGLTLGVPTGVAATAAQQTVEQLTGRILKGVRLNIPNWPLVNRIMLDLELRGEVQRHWCASAVQASSLVANPRESLRPILEVPEPLTVQSDRKRAALRLHAAQVATRALLAEHAPDLVREVEIACLARARRDCCGRFAPSAVETLISVGIPPVGPLKARRASIARSRAAFFRAREYGLIEVDAALAHLSIDRRAVLEQIDETAAKHTNDVWRQMAQSIAHQHTHPRLAERTGLPAPRQ